MSQYYVKNEKKNRKQSYFFYIKNLLIILLAVGIFLLVAVKKSGNNVQNIAIVKATSRNIYQVKPINLSVGISGVGVATPVKYTSLYFSDVSGSLKRLYVNQGDTVKKGAYIATIDAGNLNYNLAMQKLEVEKAKLNVTQFNTQINDVKNLVKIANVDYLRLRNENKKLPGKNAQALKAAKLSLEQLNIQLKSAGKDKTLAQINVQSTAQTDQSQNVKQAQMKIEQIDSNIKGINKAIEIENVDNKLYKEELGNKDLLNKSNLRLSQLQAQLESSQKAKQLVELSLKKAKTPDEIQSANLSIKQAKDGILIAQNAIDLEKIDNADIKKNVSNDDLLKKSNLRLEQLNSQLAAAKKEKSIAELDLKKQKAINQNLNRQAANIALQKSQYQIDSVNKSIQMNQVDLSNTEEGLKEQLNTNNSEIQKLQIQLEGYKSQLYAINSSKQLAILNQKGAILTMDSIKRKIQNCSIKSPVKGVVIFVDKVVETDLINSGRIIAKVANPKDIVMRVISSDLSTLKYGMKVNVSIGNKNYKALVYQPKPGDIISAETGNSKIKTKLYLAFVDGIKNITLNQQMDVKVELDGMKNVLAVPKSAVKSEGSKYWVNVLRQGKEKQIRIKKGIETSTMVEIKQGLKKGDKVLLSY